MLNKYGRSLGVLLRIKKGAAATLENTAAKPAENPAAIMV
jgi:hypothetical protein